MNIFKSFLITGCTIFVGLIISSVVLAGQDSDQQKLGAKLNTYLLIGTGQSLEVRNIISDNNIQKSLSSDTCTSGDFVVPMVFGGLGIDILHRGEVSEISNIEPTATVNWIFEINNNPFNNIPELPSDESLFARFGDDITITNDPDDDNLVIVAIPALTVEDSHAVLCKTFDVVRPPRLLIDGINTESLLVVLDVEFVKFVDTPLLQTREIRDRSFIRIESN
ncbi:MAG: hypothetical protein ACUZ8O_01915 [Candidatus Anammoxibacter sp.]